MDQVNASGTILSTAKPLMPSNPPVNLADPSLDYCTMVTFGKQLISVKTAIAMGVLTRNGSTLTENYAFNQGGPGGPTTPRPFPF